VLAEAGYATVELPQLGSWRPGRGGSAVVVAVPDAGSLEDVRAFGEEHPDVPVVAVVDDLSVATFAGAVRAGAIAAIDDDEPVEAFVVVLESAFQGRAAVPESVMRAMAARIPGAPHPSAWITDEEADWLRCLAAGETVADIADRVGYSEREMFRTLRETYTKLGARNRTEAIIWASRHGLLEEPAGSGGEG
jgi:DNA-binding NarL/FixJ family response regulator